MFEELHKSTQAAWLSQHEHPREFEVGIEHFIERRATWYNVSVSEDAEHGLMHCHVYTLLYNYERMSRLAFLARLSMLTL
jgi:hypothetical protein